MNHLHMPRSEIMNMPVSERNFYFDQLKQSVDKHNQEVAKATQKRNG